MVVLALWPFHICKMKILWRELCFYAYGYQKYSSKYRVFHLMEPGVVSCLRGSRGSVPGLRVEQLLWNNSLPLYQLCFLWSVKVTIQGSDFPKRRISWLCSSLAHWRGYWHAACKLSLPWTPMGIIKLGIIKAGLKVAHPRWWMQGAILY